MASKVVHTSGKRKEAIARATLYPNGQGRVRVNNMQLSHFSNPVMRLRVQEPLLLIEDVAKTVDIDVNVQGGGSNGQAEATRLAIARALVNYDKKAKKTFDEYDRQLLVADTRRKEPRKPGRQSKPRSKVQKSYR